jgi:alpha-D-ribose 1-methylphosphonate 5-triphosphate diphosphatase PhnM
MTNSTFDPSSVLEAYRNAFAPVIEAQQEGIKAIDRAGRYQYALAGDYLEWSLAQAKAAVSVQSPAEFVAKQVELSTAFSEKLRARVQEFVSMTTEATAKVADATKAAVAKAADATKKAA